ncbi:MAG: ABC transporter substrate binding protein [Pseudomonadota bacterium]
MLAGGAAWAAPDVGPENAPAITPESTVTVRRPAVHMLAQVPDNRREAQTIGVLFPDIGEPFRKVFTEIIQGIDDGTRLRVRGYPIAPGQDAAELSQQLKGNGTRVVVALGRQGLRVAAGLDLPVVVSGVSSIAEGEKQVGICLTPDPALLFGRLKSLLPAARRVHVVYNPLHNEWLIKLAREAARAQDLELVAYEARDLATAVRMYQAAFAGADKRNDAVWLPIDPTTVDERTIMPIVLAEAWNRNVALFSSSYLHVKKGALFALYPDNQALGQRLAGLAMGVLEGDPAPVGVKPLREVHAALNLRTAGHIGLVLGQPVQRSFDFLHAEP